MFSNARIVVVCIMVLYCRAATDWSLCLGGCCYYRSKNAVSWHNGLAICKAKGGDYASIHSKEENKYVQDTVCGGSHCFLGLTDANKEGTWTWTDGSPMDYTSWDSSEPNGCCGTGDHGGFYSNRYMWHDLDENWKGVYAACKRCNSNTPMPTPSPTNEPTKSPTDQPTKSPTFPPTKSPTNPPTGNPTESPSINPTESPTVPPVPDKVKSSLDVCLGIVREVVSFRDGYNTLEHRRRTTNENEELDEEDIAARATEKLGVCSRIARAVGSFHEQHNAMAEKKGGSVFKSLDDGPIVLNVGGTHFTTRLQTLRSVSGSWFHRMFREGSSTNRTDDGTYFIDRNPSTFVHILNYLRDGDLLIESNDRALRSQLLDDVEYFELPEELKLYLTYTAGVGMDLWLSELTFLSRELKKVSKKMGGLLYQNTQDGDSVGNFHSRCDGKGPTVVIFKSANGNVFGGYTSRSWSSRSSGKYYSSSGSFLFRLRPSIEKYEMKSGRESYAVYLQKSYGPTFGGGHEIWITDNCRSIASCYSSCGNTYNVPTSYELAGGSRNFRIQDYVVLLATTL